MGIQSTLDRVSSVRALLALLPTLFFFLESFYCLLWGTELYVGLPSVDSKGLS